MVEPDRLEILALMNYHSKGAGDAMTTSCQYNGAGLVGPARNYRAKADWHNARYELWRTALGAAPMPTPYE